MPLNMVGNHSYKGRDGKVYKIPEWKYQGFLVCPTIATAKGSERLFRVWSNRDREVGSFFSLTPYRTRSEAERHSSVMQFGNGILYQAQFKVKQGTPMWIGNAHPGDHSGQFGSIAGSQVFIDLEYLATAVTKVRDLPVVDDMNGAFVIDNPDRGQLNS